MYVYSTYGGFFYGGENSSRFDYVFGTSLGPWNSLGIAFAEDGDLVAVNNEATIFGLNFALEFSVSRVILEHVYHVIQANEGVIDGDNLFLVLQKRFSFVFFSPINIYHRYFNVSFHVPDHRARGMP